MLKKGIFTAAAAAAVVISTASMALAAPESSTGCAFTNGCATLHGVDANGSAVAMDAKYQNKNEILIGYADNTGDGATSFDGDLHYGKGPKVTTYQDTALQVNKYSDACDPKKIVALTVTSSLVTAGGLSLTVENAGGANFSGAGPAISLPYTGALSPSTVVDETYEPGCVAAFSGSSLLTMDAGGIITRTYTGSNSVTEFTDSDLTGTYKFDSLPAGITPSGTLLNQLSADNSTAVPSTYSSVGVTYTDSDGAEVTYAFELVVSGIKSVTPGAGVPYYTFVYANGDWTSQCVTDINGSGALKLAACTLGKDTGQDFTIDSSNGLLSGSQAHVSNLLAAATGANSCLTDPSTSDPSVPQSDAADELPPGGRQLYVNGSCAAGANLWSWGT